MKKFAALLLLLPTVFMTISGVANAQRKNTTSHDVMPQPPCVCENKQDCPCAEQMKTREQKPLKDPKHEKKTAYIRDVDEWAAEQTEEIDEKFHKIMKKLKKSELAEEDVAKLKKIATANKEAVQKYLNETTALIKKNHKDCMNIARDNHKLCKRIDKLLFID